ncbi:hypothetical protein ABW19_dt0209127 [Dactylella cylindrospora]|nr:hypothetical protein ABW19_dt0209127 [Dactylella cylindrospora]
METVGELLYNLCMPSLDSPQYTPSPPPPADLRKQEEENKNNIIILEDQSMDPDNPFIYRDAAGNPATPPRPQNISPVGSSPETLTVTDGNHTDDAMDTEEQVQQTTEYFVLARVAYLDIVSNKAVNSTPFRVIPVSGTETYDEFIAAIKNKLGFAVTGNGKFIRSIQIYDNQHEIGIVLESDYSFRYLVDLLKQKKEMKMDILVIEQNAQVEGFNRPDPKIEIPGQKAPVGRAVGQGQPQVTASHDPLNASINPYDLFREDEDDEMEDAEDPTCSYADLERSFGLAREERGHDNQQLPPYRSQPAARDPQSVLRGQTANRPSYRGRDRERREEMQHLGRSLSPGRKPEYIHERDYDGHRHRYNDPPERMPPAAYDDRFGLSTGPRNPRSDRSPEYAPPRRDNYSPRSLQPHRRQAEDMEYDQGRYDRPPARPYDHTRHLDPRPATRYEPEYMGRQNYRPDYDRHRYPSASPPRELGPRYHEQEHRRRDLPRPYSPPRRAYMSRPEHDEPRFCKIWISEAGKDQWAYWDADHLRVRLAPSNRFQYTYNLVLDEIFPRVRTLEENPRWIPRIDGTVFMLYMRTAPPPEDSMNYANPYKFYNTRYYHDMNTDLFQPYHVESIYDADTDSGVLINLEGMQPGSFKWAWRRDSMILKFRTNPNAGFIVRYTDPAVHQDAPSHTRHRTNHIGVNYGFVPAERQNWQNWKAIKAVSDALESKEKHFDIIIRVSQSQMPSDAFEVIRRCPQAKRAEGDLAMVDDLGTSRR